MVSSTGKFIFDFQKNKKLGYPTLILLFVCISNGYRNTTHTGTYTGTYTETYTVTYTEKYCFGVPANRLWFHKIQVVMTWMKRTTCMVWWVFLRFQLQRYNKNFRFPNFREYLSQFFRQSVIRVNHRGRCGAPNHATAPSCWRGYKNCSCQSCSSRKNFRERSVFCC